MPLPAGRVLAPPVAVGRGPVQDRLDASSHPASRLRLRCPDRFNGPHHEAGVDALDGQVAERRVGVGVQRRMPLRGVLGVAPAGLVRLDIGQRAFAEGHGLGGFQPGFSALRLARLDRVDALGTQLPAGQRLLSRLGQGEGRERP